MPKSLKVRRDPSAAADSAARAYLKEIDGNDFGDLEDGHSIVDCAHIIDDATKLPKLLLALKKAHAALQPFARFAKAWQEQPLRKIDDQFYGIHTGTKWEASLRLSQMKHALDLTKQLEKLPWVDLFNVHKASKKAKKRGPNKFQQQVLDQWVKNGVDWSKAIHIAERLQVPTVRAHDALKAIMKNRWLDGLYAEQRIDEPPTHRRMTTVIIRPLPGRVFTVFEVADGAGWTKAGWHWVTGEWLSVDEFIKALAAHTITESRSLPSKELAIYDGLSVNYKRDEKTI